MTKTHSGLMDAAGKKFGIVISRFNEFITGKLLEGALDCLLRHGCSEDDIEIFRVPGSFEIPSTAGKLVSAGKFDAVICLGALIRGSTPHFDYLSAEVTKGVAQLSLLGKVPVIFGVVIADTIEQAIERAGTKAGNKGKDAAENAIEMVNLWKEL
ncbi:MAG: 6,7-dimethyl-8-ribityllumazine synthase [candidate division Zixibacteria bacterium]|nr:6,7-dimethyl-8-ribityllumazine synthase [Candidatus Tariuqbacter arcticus]